MLHLLLLLLCFQVPQGMPPPPPWAMQGMPPPGETAASWVGQKQPQATQRVVATSGFVYVYTQRRYRCVP